MPLNTLSILPISRNLALLVALGALACKGGDKGTETGTIDSGCLDSDGDGFCADEDCDDGDITISPDADELCDGIDNDCDEEVDEGDAVDGTIYYHDADGDGYGDQYDATVACSVPSGYTENSGDCNDADETYNPAAQETDCTDPNDYNCDGSVGTVDADGDGWVACQECNDADNTIYPDADEYCDEVDNDCDGETDEDSAVDATDWYIDYDTDGYGSDRYTREGCEQPVGYVDNSDDCNDANDDSFPGATEVCDGADTDCDGEVDEADAADAPTWYYDGDDDGYGVSDTTTVACPDADGYGPDGYVDTIEDCDDDDAAISPDGTEICDGLDNNCDGEVDEDEAEDATIYYVDGDEDGYGLDRFYVLACDGPSGYSETGGDCDDSDDAINPDADEVCDLADNDCDGVTDEADSEDAYTWYGDNDGDGFGGTDTFEVSCESPDGYAAEATDCDDGDEDINPDATEVCNDGIDNNCDGDGSHCLMSLTDSDVILMGEGADDGAGNAFLGMGDLNGDGYGDVLIGASLEDTSGADAGAAYLVYGPFDAGTGEVSLSDADAKFIGEDTDYGAGRSLGAPGDVNGDGYDDILVGSHRVDVGGRDQFGAVYLFYGPVSGEIDLGDAPVQYQASAAFDRLGYSVAAPGDMDGDGVPDMALGANATDTSGKNTNDGSVYFLYGPVTADLGAVDIEDEYYARLDAEASEDRLGSELRGAGDVDGDGYQDVLAGVSAYDYDDYPSTGAAYVIYGPVTDDGTVSDFADRMVGSNELDLAGGSISGAGDVNGDGYDDVLVGARGDDSNGSSAGAAYLVMGPISADSGTLDLGDVAIRYVGDETHVELGGGVGGGGDQDGDGNLDILVGAPSDDLAGTGAGSVMLYRGPFTAGTYTASEADAIVTGGELTASAGGVVGFAPNLDGSGLDAVIVGAADDNRGGLDAGAGFILLSIGE